MGFLGTSVLSIYLSSILPWTIVEGTLFTLFDVPIVLKLPILWFIPASFTGLAIFRIYDVRYIIDEQGLEAVRGILALNQKRIRVRYEDIRSVRTHQAVVDRLMDIGDVEVGTAATSQLEITFQGVGAPLEIHAMIELEKQRRQELANKKKKTRSSNS